MKNKVTFALIFALVVMMIGGVFFYKTPSLFHHHVSHAEVQYYCPMHPSYTSNHPGNCPICNMKLVARETQTATKTHDNHGSAATMKEFSIQEIVNMKSSDICLLHKCKMGNCQMVMTEELARLGKCPHCGEDLGIIIKENLPPGYANVKLTSGKQEAIGIQIASVVKKQISKTIHTTGRIAYDPELYEMQKDYLAMRREFIAMQYNLASPVKQKMVNELNLAREQLHLLGMTDDSIKKLELSTFADIELVLPKPKGPVWLYVTIYDFERPYIKEKQKVEVRSNLYPNQTFYGEVRAIDLLPDSENRSAVLPRVRALIENPKGLLQLNMPVEVQFETSLGSVLMVPQEAIFQTGEENIIFVKKNDETFEPRHVVVGERVQGEAEILSGLSEGEQIVVSGNFLIDSESRLKGALEGMSSGGEHHHGI